MKRHRSPQRARDMPEIELSDAIFLTALSELFTDQPDAEYAARQFLR
jgi:hypothetical protein